MPTHSFFHLFLLRRCVILLPLPFSWWYHADPTYFNFSSASDSQTQITFNANQSHLSISAQLAYGYECHRLKLSQDSQPPQRSFEVRVDGSDQSSVTVKTGYLDRVFPLLLSVFSFSRPVEFSFSYLPRPRHIEESVSVIQIITNTTPQDRARRPSTNYSPRPYLARSPFCSNKKFSESSRYEYFRLVRESPCLLSRS